MGDKDLVLLEKNLGESIDKLFGCINCEFRGTKDCPTEGAIHLKGICDHRKQWVMSLVPHYDSPPSFSRFMLDFSKNLGHTISMQDLKKMRDWELVRDNAIKTGDEGAVRRADKMVRQLKQDWKEVWREVARLEDSQVARDTPKQIEVTKHEIRPKDMIRWLREQNKGLVVDAKVVK